MISVPGYQIRELILEEPHLWVCRAFSEQSGGMVTMKLVKEGQQRRETAKLKHEFELARRLDVPGILKPQQLLEEGGLSFLTLQWLNGYTLQDYCRTHTVSVPAFLEIAIAVCRILGHLHEQAIIHRNIRPATILYVPATRRAYLTGLGHSLAGGKRNRPPGLPLPEASPPYMAPESTRGLGWDIDARSDLYSLGVSFYELLTARLPFLSATPLDWAHAHAARTPLAVPPGSGIPPIVSAILNKLMRKDPSERYQSASSLRTDLQRCLDFWREHGTWTWFEPGLQDEQQSRLAGTRAAQPGTATATVRTRLRKPAGPPMETFDQMDMEYAHSLDLAAVWKAAHVLAKETDPLKQKRRLLAVLAEMAGAQKAVLLSVRNDLLDVETVTEQDDFPRPQPAGIPFDGSSDTFSMAVVRQAVLSREALLVHDAREVRALAEDPYIRRAKPRSILVQPLYSRGTMTRLLYLENSLLTRAFPKERVRSLQMLVSQMMAVLDEPLAAGQQAAAASEAGYLFLDLDEPLTIRETEVLGLLAEGLSNQEIAERLFLAIGTVKVHVKNIFRKLNVSSRTKAVAQARIYRLLPGK